MVAFQSVPAVQPHRGHLATSREGGRLQAKHRAKRADCTVQGAAHSPRKVHPVPRCRCRPSPSIALACYLGPGGINQLSRDSKLCVDTIVAETL